MHFDEKKKRAQDSQIVRAKEKCQTHTHRLKFYVRAAIESEA